MKVIDGDIFSGAWDGMVHCANLYHTMGGGIARIIKERFPEAYEADCQTRRSDVKKLGTFSRAVIHLPESFEIFNLYGQMGMGSDGHPLRRNARYDAIYDGVWSICDFISKERNGAPYVLAFPYKMASDLAGGDWAIVEAILQSVESHFANISFVVYRLKTV